VTSTTAESATHPKPALAHRRETFARSDRLFREMDLGPLLLDAGMGTRLCSAGLDLRVDDPCLWNLDRPDVVLDLHLRDATAGSRVFFTNTFGANQHWLARLGRPGDTESINRSGVELARRAARPSGFVVGDIGPSAADNEGAAVEQAAVLLDAGVDALVLETFQFEAAVAAVSALNSNMPTLAVPLMVSLCRWPEAVEEAALRLVEAGVAVVGVNCRPALGDVLSLVRRLARAVACPLLVKPGVAAGDPPGLSTPAAFVAAVPEMIRHNVRLIGGCCGTTETHIAAIAAACTGHRIPENHERQGIEP
jgi:methionine synthase I (cobalamin-dependent)